MAGTISSYVPSVIPDYSATTLSITPQNILVETGNFRQDVIEYDDNSISVLSLSTTPKFWFLCQWDVLTASEAQMIFDFYFNVNKAKGRARTFKFQHPVESTVYVVQFDCDLSKSIKYWSSINEIKLRVRGRTS